MAVSNKNTTCEINDAQMKFYKIYSWWLVGIGTVCIATLGIIFNTIAIYILCNKRLRSSFFNKLLVCLAIVDNLFLATAIYQAVGTKLIISSSYNHLFICIKLLYPARNMLMGISIYMTVSLACDRYNSISKPYTHRTRQNTNTCHRLLLYLTPVITLSIIYYTPKVFELNVEEISSNCDKKLVNETLKPKCSPEFAISPTAMRLNHEYVLWYRNISNLVVTSAIPFVLLTFFNYKIYTLLKKRHLQRASMVSRSIERSEKERSGKESRQSFVLFAIVVLFVICNALRVILSIGNFANLETIREQQKQGCPGATFWALVAFPCSELLLQINSGTNFFIYCVYDDIFKAVLKSNILKARYFVCVQKTTRSVQVQRRNQNDLCIQNSPRQDIELHEIH